MPTSRNAHESDPVRYLPSVHYPQGDWAIWVTWVTTPDGRAVPGRITVEAHQLMGTEPGDRLPPVEVPALSGSVLRNLHLGTFIAESRADALRGMAESDPDRAAMSARAPTSHDGRRRRAAQVVWNVRQTNRRSPYAEAALLLWREGITDPDGEPLKPRRLAKWIKDAETRGEYPPPNREEGSK